MANEKEKYRYVSDWFAIDNTDRIMIDSDNRNPVNQAALPSAALEDVRERSRRIARRNAERAGASRKSSRR